MRVSLAIYYVSSPNQFLFVLFQAYCVKVVSIASISCATICAHYKYNLHVFNFNYFKFLVLKIKNIGPVPPHFRDDLTFEQIYDFKALNSNT